MLTVLLLIVILLSVAMGYALGWHNRVITDYIREHTTKDTGEVVTPLPPGYSAATSSVVTPKSPIEVDRDEEERLRKMNGY